MFQIHLGEQYIETEGVSKNNWEEVAANPANIYLSKFLKSHSQKLILNLREAVREKDIENVYAIESYIRALEDISDFINSGIHEALKNPENQ